KHHGHGANQEDKPGSQGESGQSHSRFPLLTCYLVDQAMRRPGLILSSVIWLQSSGLKINNSFTLACFYRRPDAPSHALHYCTHNGNFFSAAGPNSSANASSGEARSGEAGGAKAKEASFPI